MIAYFDCFSGASGDMVLGALVDAGWEISALERVVHALGLADVCHVTARETRREAFRATRVRVETTETQTHRHLRHILELIDSADLTEAVKNQAAEVFTNLGKAEARVHGCSLEEVHFHEVGAVDAIVDIVGVMAGLESLGVTQVYAAPLPLGQGQVKSDHGTIPLPAPATLELIAAAQTPTCPAQTERELVTPTGAAILTTLATFRQPALRLTRVGVGAGGRDDGDSALPNVLRMWLGEESATPQSAAWGQADHIQLETHIDDMSPELLGHAMERLFDAGALDVSFTAIQMKKNRPGVLLGIIARADDEARLAELILKETTTLGVRALPFKRYEAAREIRTVHTEFGDIRVKVKLMDGRVAGVSPEYEDCKRVAAERGVAIGDVFGAAVRVDSGLDVPSLQPAKPDVQR